MPHSKFPTDEIIRRGQELYTRKIRQDVERAHAGKFLVLDIETGEYEIDSDQIAALDRAKAKHSDAALYILRIGSPAAARLGGHLRITPS